MVKLFAVLKRKKGITLEDFLQYWYQKHAALARSIIPEKVRWGIRNYIQNHAVSLGSESQYDAVAEICFYDMDSFRNWNEWYFSNDAKVLRDDEDNFMDKSKRIIVVTEEKMVTL